MSDSTAYHIEDWSGYKNWEMGDCFTIVPNIIFDVLQPTLGPSAFRIFCWLWRKQIGWVTDRRRPETFEEISLEQFIAGIHSKMRGDRVIAPSGVKKRETVVKAINKLERLGLIEVKRRSGKASRFRINPDFSVCGYLERLRDEGVEDPWGLVPRHMLSGKECEPDRNPPQKRDSYPDDQTHNRDTTGTDKGTAGVPESGWDHPPHRDLTGTDGATHGNKTGEQNREKEMPVKKKSSEEEHEPSTSSSSSEFSVETAPSEDPDARGAAGATSPTEQGAGPPGSDPDDESVFWDKDDLWFEKGELSEEEHKERTELYHEKLVKHEIIQSKHLGRSMSEGPESGKTILRSIRSSVIRFKPFTEENLSLIVPLVARVLEIYDEDRCSDNGVSLLHHILEEDFVNDYKQEHVTETYTQEKRREKAEKNAKMIPDAVGRKENLGTGGPHAGRDREGTRSGRETRLPPLDR